MTDDPMSGATAADLVEETVRILQRGLPGGDLDDKGVVVELWRMLHTASARAIYRSESTGVPIHRSGQ